MSLRILITNNTLAGRAGTELYVRDVATSLLARGHAVVAYSTVLGEVADELRAATIPVTDRLDSLSIPPDVIHGHHHLETMSALLHYPDIPAVYFCHGWLPFEETPPKFPRILRYVAVDQTCRDRLVYENGISAERVRLLLNFVDLRRFKPRGPLPDKPTRALVLSNAAADHNTLPAIRQACARFGIDADAVGQGVGNPAARPEDLIGKYDLVFAKGRAALEALAVGAAVIACDTVGAGPLVTPANMKELRQLNFGIRALNKPVDAEYLAGEIARYDARQAGEVSSWVRKNSDMEAAVDRIVELYEEVLNEHRDGTGTSALQEMRAAADYLRYCAPHLTREQMANFQKLAALSDQNAQLLHELNSARKELAEIHGSSAMRLRHRLVSLPIVGPWLKSLARAAAERFGKRVD